MSELRHNLYWVIGPDHLGNAVNGKSGPPIIHIADRPRSAYQQLWWCALTLSLDK
jgi:hypothetical protein